MIFKQSGSWKFVTVPLFVLLTGVVAACGSASANTGSASATPTATTACLSLTTGTIQSVSGTTLQINNMQGKSVQATLTSKTTISQQKTLKTSDIKTGSLVSVTVKQNADNTYSALTITVRSSQAVQGGFGGFGRGGGARGAGGAKLCNAQGRPRANGTPGAFGGPGGGSGVPGGGFGQGRQTISGTVTQLKGTSLTLTDASSNDYTVGLTSTTRIATQQIITSSDLHSGEAVTIIGTASGNGGISASSVSVLQGLPIRRVRPTATPTATSGA